MSKKYVDFNNFHFKGLNWENYTNTYLRINKRVSDDNNKIAVSPPAGTLFPTPYGYGLICSKNKIAWLKSWQVVRNYAASENGVTYYRYEIVLDRDYFHTKDAREPFETAGDDWEMDTFDKWLELAHNQELAGKDCMWRKTSL